MIPSMNFDKREKGKKIILAYWHYKMIKKKMTIRTAKLKIEN